MNPPVNWGPLLACGVLAVPVITAAAVLHDRPAPQLETLQPPVYVVHEVTTIAVPATTAPVVESPPPAPAIVVTESADRGIMLQVTPTVPPPTTWPRHQHYDIWIQLAECESGGDWSINTGNGYYGGLQFGMTSWRGVGGTGWPHQASIWEQMFRAELLLDLQGWGAWPSCSRKLGLR